MKRKIRQQEEQRIKYQGGVSRNTKMEETDNNQEENEEKPKLGLIAQEELNQKEFEDTANAFGSFDPFGGDDGGGGGDGNGGGGSSSSSVGLSLHDLGEELAMRTCTGTMDRNDGRG